MGGVWVYAQMGGGHGTARKMGEDPLLWDKMSFDLVASDSCCCWCFCDRPLICLAGGRVVGGLRIRMPFPLIRFRCNSTGRRNLACQ